MNLQENSNPEACLQYLLNELVGCSYAGAIMPWGRPGPIRLPENIHKRESLVRAHIAGKPAVVTYEPENKRPEQIRVEKLILASFAPRPDGLVNQIAFDLDSSEGHGQKGLVDPLHAARCLAERADSLGLSSGVLVCRSKSGLGYHVRIIPPGPVLLADAVLITANLAGQARRIADRDFTDNGNEHAFLCGDGSIAKPGDSGAFELIPKSTKKPPLGWPLTLPAAGAYADQGGGITIDVFENRPITLTHVPQCSLQAWQRGVREIYAELDVRRNARHKTQGEKHNGWRDKPATQKQISLLQELDVQYPANLSRGQASELIQQAGRNPLNRISHKTRNLLDGCIPEGNRNNAAFAAMMNMLEAGTDPQTASNLVIQGACRCGLSEREAQIAINSALRRKGVAA